MNFFKKPFAVKSSLCIADSQTGNRNENQDNYLVILPNGQSRYLNNQQETDQQQSHWPDTSYRLMVADGMGGHKNGREIAQATTQAIARLPTYTRPEKLRQALYKIHQQLWQTYHSHAEDTPGTTLLMADITTQGKALIASVGDSRAYLWRNQQWQQISHDQTIDEYNWRDGELTTADYNPEQKNHQLAQAMGYGSFGLIKDEYSYKPRRLNQQLRLDLAKELPEHARQHADIFTLQLRKSEALLLATDGLWSCPEGQQPLALPAPHNLADQAALRAHLYQVIQQGGQDNVTAVLIMAKTDD